MADYLFTYGTLRLNQSQPIAEFLTESAALVGLAVLSKAQLYKVDWYPVLIETDKEFDEVIGDLYKLNHESALQIIDEYEGIGIGDTPYEYRRVKVKVRMEHQELESWVYFYNADLPSGASLIDSGDFLNP
jgi:gamma-glutamylcyclotransferase (GGCT)/AIG2-like uncharacterized protein YtfP